MKKQLFTMSAIVILLLTSNATTFGQKEYTVAFRTVAGEPSRYITYPGNCEAGLNSGRNEITANAIFTLIDLNEGVIEDGDSVRIKCGDKHWRASGNSIALEGGIVDKATKFKVKRFGNFIMLYTYNRRSFVVAPANGGSLSTNFSKIEEDKQLGIFELKFNPAIR